MRKFFKKLWFGIFLLLSTVSFAETFANASNGYSFQNEPGFQYNVPTQPNPVAERTKKEKNLPPDFFAINFYKPTYVLPYYYTGSPFTSVYKNSSQNIQSLNHSEVKYQFSVKVPIVKNVFNRPSFLYLAYTQLSYWQAYNNDPFFRESDYEPEIFLANEINQRFIGNSRFHFLNVGATHQSNGYGGTLERSWNRLYMEGIISSNNWEISLKPWYIVRDSTMKRQNSDIGKYMGYGQFLAAYKFNNKHVVSLQIRNLIESSGKRVGAELTWSFPITGYFKGFIDVFSGYGQSLIEYDHHTNSAGLGIALSDWI